MGHGNPYLPGDVVPGIWEADDAVRLTADPLARGTQD